MNQKKNRNLKVATVVSTKAGKTAIKTNVDLTVLLEDGSEVMIKKGSYLNTEDPRELPKRLLAEGKISEDLAAQMQERADKTPDFVLRDITFYNKG